MFENLTTRIKDVLGNLGKKPSITEQDLDVVLREIRLVLLEADVSLPVAKALMEKLKEDLLGKQIYKAITPKAVISKALYDTLFNLLDISEHDVKLYDKTTPAYYMMVGLQGSGKTTTSAKLANYLKTKQNKKVLLVSLDFNRPAAYSQLQILCSQNALDFFEYTEKNLDKVIENTKSYATKNAYDVVILDTAGRLSIDDTLMNEMKHIYSKATPKEVLLVMDSSVGQISFEVAKHFSEKIALSGIIISKADADSRGGAIISCKYVTQKPIKFMGVGEKVSAFEVFSPKRVVDRILDEGDILSLVDKFEEVEEDEIQKLQQRMEKGLFNLNDFKKQMQQMSKLGGAGGLMSLLPGVGALKEKIQGANLDGEIKKSIAIINSMTPLERKRPGVLNFSRKKRITAGSGTTLQDMNIMMKKYDQAEKMMKKMKKGGMSEMKTLMDNMQKGGKMDMASIMKMAKKLK